MPPCSSCRRPAPPRAARRCSSSARRARPTTRSGRPATMLAISGWGSTSEGGSIPQPAPGGSRPARRRQHLRPERLLRQRVRRGNDGLRRLRRRRSRHVPGRLGRPARRVHPGPAPRRARTTRRSGGSRGSPRGASAARARRSPACTRASRRRRSAIGSSARSPLRADRVGHRKRQRHGDEHRRQHQLSARLLVRLRHGDVVTLNANAAAGSHFTGWSGACSGTGGCTVTMTRRAASRAQFTNTSPTPTMRTLTVTKAGGGTRDGHEQPGRDQLRQRLLAELHRRHLGDAHRGARRPDRTSPAGTARAARAPARAPCR